MDKKKKNQLQQMYGNCVSIEVMAFDDGLLFDVCLQPVEIDKRESFIKDVRALLSKYFGDSYYDFELSDDE